MTTIASTPTLNRYFTANPAEIAQNKYTQQAWKERYAYISMVAFIALAAVANYFLSPLVLPITLVYVNFGVLSAASNLLVPRVLQWFAEAKKLKAHGDNETKIQEKLQEIQAMNHNEISGLYMEHALPKLHERTPEQTASERPLVARALYWNDQAKELGEKIQTLLGENKWREALETELLSIKAKLKAAYYSALISHPTLPGKFKDSIALSDWTLEQWAFERALNRRNSQIIARTKGPEPMEIRDNLIHLKIGPLAAEIFPILDPSESSENSTGD